MPVWGRMTIAFLSTRSGLWGGEIHLLQLASGLARRGHDVVCCVRPDGELAPRLRAAGLEVQPLPLVDWFEPFGTARLAHWLRRRRVAILHSHCPRDHYLSAVATLGSDTRNVGTRHQLRPIGCPALKRPFFRRFAAMIAVSEAVRAAFVASGVMDPRRVVTIPNGIDDRRRLPRRDGLRRLAGLDADVPVIGYVGRLSREKGIETLLEAAARLRGPDGAAPWLFIVGREPDAGKGYTVRLAAMATRLGIGPTTRFFGWVEDAASASADFDVHVVPSQAEPFGLSTLEGMAHGHAVIATASGGSPEILRHGVDGLLVPPGDPEALAAGLARLLADPALRERLGARARQRVQESFSLRGMVEAVEAVYAGARAGAAPA